MTIHFFKKGSGPKLLLVHGLGGNSHSFDSIINELAMHREVIAVDLPGFGDSLPLPGEVTISTLSAALAAFLKEQNLIGIDAVGSSMGARLVIEMKRQGNLLGDVVSLDPGGFWKGFKRHLFFGSIYLSIRLVRLLNPFLSKICNSKLGRTILFAQFSARPWNLSAKEILTEMRSYIHAQSFDELLYNLTYGETQKGAPKNSITGRLTIGWGKHDRVCFSSQAKYALKLFPDATLHWFTHSGHFPHWDEPQKTVQFILDNTQTKSFGKREHLDKQVQLHTT